LEPCNHTKLMNYIIGMCKKQEKWISTLHDLGYEPQLIEQRFRTSTDEIVKPDIVAASNRLLHFLVFECKGGVTVEKDQLRRYKTLIPEDVFRWIRPHVHTPSDFRLDVCISDFKENHHIIASKVENFPILTFSEQELSKTRQFDNMKLDNEFKDPISLQGMVPPLSYYSFCENDSDSYVAPFVIRGLLSIAIKKGKGGPSVFEEAIVTQEEIVNQIFHPIFDALSDEHKGKLENKIKQIIAMFMKRETVKDLLEFIEKRSGWKVPRQLGKLESEAKNFIEYLQTQKSLIAFFPK